jgi:hypothetical protein
MSGNEWALREANRIRVETMRECEPEWSETLEETAAYLERLGKSPLDYVEAWLAFRPSLEAFRRPLAMPRGDASPRVAPRRTEEKGEGLTANAGARGGRWFTG